MQTQNDIEAIIKENIKLREELAQFKTLSVDYLNSSKKILSLQQELRKLKAEFKQVNQYLSAQNTETQQEQNEIRAQAEAFLMSSIEYEKLSIAARKTDNSIIIMDSKGNFEWANDGFEHMYGLPFEEYILAGNNIIETSTNPDIFEYLLSVVNEKKTLVYESSFIKKNGQKIWLQTTLTPITDDDDEIYKIIAVESDISKLKQAEQEIRHKNQEIEAQRDTLEQKNRQIEFQNENIRSSIRYALTIQQAALPKKEDIDKHFDNFILYRPKDIVSGDFYWFTIVEKQFNPLQSGTINLQKNAELMMFAVADCTGHGVPGAFMSLIGIQLLNKIVLQKKIYNPEEILEQLDIEIQQALRQKETDNQDGMDIALCLFEKVNENQTKVLFSSSKRSLFYFNHENHHIEVIHGDRKTIGGTIFKTENQVFKNKEILLQKDDILFLTTDGIFDQNNPERQKFGAKRLINILLQNIDLPLSRQKIALEVEIEKYQQNEEQRDDITVVALKY